MPLINIHKQKNNDFSNRLLTDRYAKLNYLNSLSPLNKKTKNKTKSTYELFYHKNINKNFSSSKKEKDRKDKEKLEYIFKKPEEKMKHKFVWPKITHHKLPFSKREKISEEERNKKIREQKPNRIYHTYYMIKWLRSKYSDSLIEKSVFSMLPDNGKPVVPDDESEEEKRHRLLMEYVDSLYKRVPEREKYVNINPKYFFDQKTFEKILKFKEIFLEFDEDQSRKMEIDEMVEMFNQNHIEATLEDLRNLFFKDKRVKKEDIMKLYLDFYQFMNFALTKDQDFRNFMREIKEKRKKKEKKNNTIRSPKEKNEEDDDVDERYLPMNFNLMFDYFLMKGKERASVDEIEKGMNEMDRILNAHKKAEEEARNSITEEKMKQKNLKRKNSVSLFNFFEFTNKNNSNEDIKKINLDYDEQLKNLNFINLIDNFKILFHINDSPKKSMSDSFIELIENHKQTSGIKVKKIKENNNIKINPFNESEDNDEVTKNENMKKNLSGSDSLNGKAFEKIINYNINRKIIKNLNLNNYKKYHDVNMALTETKKEVNSFFKTQKLKLNSNKNKYKLKINDNSIINLNSDSKINSIFTNKLKGKSNKINPNTLYKYDKTKNYISKKYFNSVKMHYGLDAKDINNFNSNKDIKNDHKRENNSINPYLSKGVNKDKNVNKMDFVPLSLLKEKRIRKIYLD